MTHLDGSGIQNGARPESTAGSDKLLLYGAFALAALFAFFPVYWMLVTSLKFNEEVFRFPPELHSPDSITLEHYANFISDPAAAALHGQQHAGLAGNRGL